MKKYIIYLQILISSTILVSCAGPYNSTKFQHEIGVRLADTLASKETVLLYYNLKKLSQKNTVFGHQHSTAYGVGWQGQPNRSDVKDVSDYFPGLYGWDFEPVTPPLRPGQSDWMKKLVIEAYNRGGINTFCWHYYNPVTGNDFYDTTVAVKYILPGGNHNEDYKKALDIIADYAKNLVADDGSLIPVIFRPYHEFDGSWFWWGKRFCTREEFIALWRFTVGYLRDVKGVKNFLYAFSPDRNFYSEQQYLDRYPGDDYVDILGVDNYYDFNRDGDGLEWVTKKLKIVSRLALEKNKISAFTETGSEGIPDAGWWTNTLLRTMSDDSIKMAYLMVWRNANTHHHYAPFKGDISANNFVEFSRQPNILFEEHLPDMYHKILDDKTMFEIAQKRTAQTLLFLMYNYLWF